MNLLFIDDCLDILHLYKVFLTNKENYLTEKYDFLTPENEEKVEQHNLFFASQGLEGVSIVKDQIEKNDPIDIVFVDMRMPPGIDGSETARLIREIDKDIELVIVTAYSDKTLEQIINSVGSSQKIGYIQKPFNIGQLEEVIETYTSRKSNFLSTPQSSL